MPYAFYKRKWCWFDNAQNFHRSRQKKFVWAAIFHELRIHLSKVVCDNMPSLSPPKTRHMRAVLPCIDAALNQTWKVQAVFFKLNCSWQFLLTSLFVNGFFQIATLLLFFFVGVVGLGKLPTKFLDHSTLVLIRQLKIKILNKYKSCSDLI